MIQWQPLLIVKPTRNCNQSSLIRFQFLLPAVCAQARTDAVRPGVPEAAHPVGAHIQRIPGGVQAERGEFCDRCAGAAILLNAHLSTALVAVHAHPRSSRCGGCHREAARSGAIVTAAAAAACSV